MTQKKIWLTEIKALSPEDGSMQNWCGPRIEAETAEEAEKYCEENGLGYEE